MNWRILKAVLILSMFTIVCGSCVRDPVGPTQEACINGTSYLILWANSVSRTIIPKQVNGTVQTCKNP